jgi:hypothetical protein
MYITQKNEQEKQETAQQSAQGPSSTCLNTQHVTLSICKQNETGTAKRWPKSVFKTKSISKI